MGVSRVAVMLLLVLCLHALAGADARYLPTRGQDDRLDRLRELIRDLLESEVDKYNVNMSPAELFAADRGFAFKERPVAGGRAMLADEDQK